MHFFYLSPGVTSQNPVLIVFRFDEPSALTFGDTLAIIFGEEFK